MLRKQPRMAGARRRQDSINIGPDLTSGIVKFGLESSENIISIFKHFVLTIRPSIPQGYARKKVTGIFLRVSS